MPNMRVMPISYGRTYFAATVLVLGAMILCELRAAVDAFAGTDAITSNTRSLHIRRRGEYVTVRRLQRRCNHRSMAMHFSSNNKASNCTSSSSQPSSLMSAAVGGTMDSAAHVRL